MLLIKNGTVCDPVTGREGPLELAISKGRILAVGERLDLGHLLPEQPLQEAGKAVEVLDAKGWIVAPGLVDAHVHFRDPGFPEKETIMTGAAAAAKGGFTTVILMANTRPPVDNVETLRYVMEKGEQTGIHVRTCANVTTGMKGREPVDMKALLAAGALGFTDDGIPLLDEALTRRAMEEAAKYSAVLSFHEEDPAFITNNGINRGAAASWFGIGGSDRQAEISMVERDLRLAKETGAQIVIQHISAKETVRLVRQAKAEGYTNIHAEATPHHFSLTEEAAIRFGSLAKMNPPLREEADRQAIVEGLSDGTIELIATDHAPHTELEKAKPLTEAPSGIIGLETSLSLGLMCLVNTGALSLRGLLRAMSSNAAALYGLPAGSLEEGAPADLVLFDPAQSWTAERFVSKSQNSPFLGTELTGKVKYTICGGRIVYRG